VAVFGPAADARDPDRPHAGAVRHTSYVVATAFSTQRMTTVSLVVALLRGGPGESGGGRDGATLEGLKLVPPETWKVLVTWFFDYPHANLYHHVFYELLWLVLRSNHTPSLQALFQKQRLVTLLMDEYARGAPRLVNVAAPGLPGAGGGGAEAPGAEAPEGGAGSAGPEGSEGAEEEGPEVDEGDGEAADGGEGSGGEGGGERGGEGGLQSPPRIGARPAPGGGSRLGTGAAWGRSAATKKANRGHVLKCCNAVRLQCETLPPSAFLRLYLRAHEPWQGFAQTVLRADTAAMLQPGGGFAVPRRWGEVQSGGGDGWDSLGDGSPVSPMANIRQRSGEDEHGLGSQYASSLGFDALEVRAPRGACACARSSTRLPA
jgi:hypothetical protein